MKKKLLLVLLILAMTMGLYPNLTAEAAITYYEAKTSDTQVKKSYSSSSETVVKLPSGYVVKAKASKTNDAGNVWYQLDSGSYGGKSLKDCWVWSGNFKAHTHNYKSNGGVCKSAGCGVSFKLSPTSYSATVEVSNTNGTGIWSLPYSTGKSSNVRNAAYQEVLKVTQKAENADENVWYKLSDGNWVYSGHTKKHTHNFRSNGGVCTYKGCGASYTLSPTAFSATYVVTNSSGTTKWTLPYTTGKSKSTALAKDTVLTITHKVTNADGNEWYKLSDGQWVYPDSKITRRYTIKYNTNGGNVSVATQYKLQGKTLTLTSVKPKKTGYLFSSWNTKSDGSGTSYSSGGSYTANADATLYAIYTKCTSHDYSNNGGVCKKCGYEYPLSITSLTSTTYMVTRDGGTDIYNKPYSTNSTLIRTDAKGKVLTVNAKTTNQAGNVWYRLSDGYWAYSGHITQCYKINYNLNGGTNNSGNPAYIGGSVLLKDPTRTGYTFAGWYTDSDFVTQVTLLPYVPGGTYNVYAKWTANKYKIAFDGNGSTSGSMSTLSATYGKSVTLTSNAFKRTNYSFNGWNTKSNGSGTSYSNGASVSNLTSTSGGTVTLYAQWKMNKPSISTQPVAISAAAGDTAAFTVKASGASLSYKWQYSDDGSTWTTSSYSGWNTSTLSVNADTNINGRKFRCVVSNSGGSVTSSAATLTVVGIYSQPASVAGREGGTAIFTVGATGAKNYQWYYRTSWSGSGTAVSGGTSSTYSVPITASRNGYQYRCRITNGEIYVYSNWAVLSVEGTTPTPPVTEIKILSQPESMMVEEGETAEFSVSATGATSFQWYYRTSSSGNGTSVGSSGTSDTYRFTASRNQDGYQYRCRLANADTYVYTNWATLDVEQPYEPVEGITIIEQPQDVTVAGEGSKATVSVVAEGEGLTYTWYVSDPGDTTFFKSAISKSEYTMTLTKEKNGRQAYCIIKDAYGNTARTRTATMRYTESGVKITTQPKSTAVKLGAKATFKVVAAGAKSYQWYYRTSSTGSWKKLTASSAKTASYSVTTEKKHNGYQYRCKVTGNDGSTVYSSTVKLTVVTAKPKITTQPASKSVSKGKTVTFKVVASGRALSYQWYYRTSSSGSWKKTTLSGAKTATLKVTATAKRNGYQYRCVVKNAMGSVTSKTAKLSVK